jgi:hypothetical protein
MSIEIYDKAEVIKMNDCFYFLLKHGSKNSFTCAWQHVLDNNFRYKFLKRQARDSSWNLIAYGFSKFEIGDTYWNAPTSTIYGEVRFGDRKNIALYLAKKKAKTRADYDDIQWQHIEEIINYGKGNAITLSEIPRGKLMQAAIPYCEKLYHLAEHKTVFAGRDYWQLDNL